MARPFTTVRGSKAWHFNAAGNVQEFANNEPAINDLGLHVYGSGFTNLCTNSDGTGAVVGTTTLPTGWNGFFTGGLVPTVAAQGSILGALKYTNLRFQGTPTATSTQSLTLGATGYGAIGEMYTNSARAGLAGGSLANVSIFTLRAGSEGGGTDFTLGALALISNTRTLAGAGNGRCQLRWNYADTVTPVDFTLRVVQPQSRLGASIGPIIVTSGSAASRVADQVTMPLGDWFSQRTGTLVVEFKNEVLDTGNYPGIAFRDSGSAGIGIYSAQPSNETVAAVRDAASVNQARLTVLPTANLSPHKIAMTWAENDFASVCDGGTVYTDNSGTVPSVTALRLHQFDQAMNGRILRVKYFKSRLSNAELQALSV